MLNERLEAAIQTMADPSSDARAVDLAQFVFFDELSRLPLSRAAQWERKLSRNIWHDRDVWTHGEAKLERARQRPWLYMLHGDGFRREAALSGLAGPAPNAFVLTLVFRRLNDWVPQVRRAARNAIKRICAMTDANIVSTALLGTFRVSGSWKRLQGEDINCLHEVLQRPDIANVFAGKLKAMTSGPGAWILREAVRTSALDHIIESMAKGAVQPALRATAWSMIFNRSAHWQSGWQWKWTDKSMGQRVREPVYAVRPLTIETDLPRAIAKALEDTSFAVHKVVGDALIKNRHAMGPDIVRTLAEALAESRNGSVAERGRFLLKALGAQVR